MGLAERINMFLVIATGVLFFGNEISKAKTYKGYLNSSIYIVYDENDETKDGRAFYNYCGNTFFPRFRVHDADGKSEEARIGDNPDDYFEKTYRHGTNVFVTPLAVYVTGPARPDSLWHIPVATADEEAFPRRTIDGGEDGEIEISHPLSMCAEGTFRLRGWIEHAYERKGWLDDDRAMVVLPELQERRERSSILLPP